jgi:hypothetical protein
LVQPTACLKLSLAEVRLAPGARHTQDRQRPQRIEVRDDQRGLEDAARIVHRLVDGAGAEHLIERVDGPVMVHNPAVRILLSHLLEVVAAHLVWLEPRSFAALQPLTG